MPSYLDMPPHGQAYVYWPRVGHHEIRGFAWEGSRKLLTILDTGTRPATYDVDELLLDWKRGMFERETRAIGDYWPTRVAPRLE